MPEGSRPLSGFEVSFVPEGRSAYAEAGHTDLRERVEFSVGAGSCTPAYRIMQSIRAVVVALPQGAALCPART